jgi:hypothetical protein
MRRSKTIVRSRILREGTLIRRLEAHDRRAAPAVLAEMSQTFNGQGYGDLARGLLVASFRSGRAWPSQRAALSSLIAARVPMRLRHVRLALPRKPARRARSALRALLRRQRAS